MGLTPDEGCILDLDELQELIGEDNDLELDEGEKNMEDEVKSMMKSWNREDLMKEIGEEKERLLKEQDKFVEHYDGESSFEDMIADMNILDRAKVYIKIIEENSDGKEVKVSNTILFDRIGFLEHNGIPFESSIYDGKPTMLNLAVGPILPGLLRGLLAMRVGERANIIIHPALAYGKLGCLPIIPPDSYLLYNVKVYKAWEESKLDWAVDYERGKFIDVPINEKFKFINEHKDVANQLIKDNMPREAIIRYKSGIKCLEEMPDEVRERSPELRALSAILHQNCAIAFNKMNMYKSASKAARKSLSADPRNVKAYYQVAKARIALADYPGALKYIEKAETIAPKNSCLKYLKVLVDSHFRDEKKERDEIMRRMSRACQ